MDGRNGFSVGFVFDREAPRNPSCAHLRTSEITGPTAATGRPQGGKSWSSAVPVSEDVTLFAQRLAVLLLTVALS